MCGCSSFPFIVSVFISCKVGVVPPPSLSSTLIPALSIGPHSTSTPLPSRYFRCLPPVPRTGTRTVCPSAPSPLARRTPTRTSGPEAERVRSFLHFASTIRCDWSYRHHSPGTDCEKFPLQLPASGTDICKHSVGMFYIDEEGVRIVRCSNGRTGLVYPHLARQGREPRRVPRQPLRNCPGRKSPAQRAAKRPPRRAQPRIQNHNRTTIRALL